MNKKYTTEECLQEYYNSIEKQLKEKDRMIDWLAKKALQCSEAYNIGHCKYMDNGCTICIQNRNMPTEQDFIDAAKKDLKNDR